MENVQGKVFKFKDNVDTDVIIPARYLNTPDANELALHCMEDIDPNFVAEVQKNDIIIAGWNFGCGSSREHAPLAIKTAGVGCVIAKVLPASFTATRSISECRFWNAKKLQTRSKPEISCMWISKQDLLRILLKINHGKRSLSLNLFKKSLMPAV